MLVSEILSTLTASSEWMVLFSLKAIRQIANDMTVEAMYHLPEGLDLDSYSHVVLNSEGRFLASTKQLELIEPISGHSWTKDDIKTSLATRFAERLALFDVDEADCLGLGEMSPFAPVILHLKLQSGVGHAQAIFDRPPSQVDFELLQAVGVTFLGGETKDDYYLARFQNRLPVHIHAGILSHFSRTAHCNIFFLRHGDIDAPLKAGLLQAAEHRVNWGKNRSFKALAKLAQAATKQTLAMICQPPLSEATFAYGDLVPLGFVLKALNQGITTIEKDEIKDLVEEASQELSQYLLDCRQGELWAFHSQRLITATDSALVLQGFNEPKSLEALEIFADGEGGYYPQLWSTDKQPNRMVLDESCTHWCQPDYATTCLVRALRQEAGLTSKTSSTEYIAAGMSSRSGLYFANPYLVDWCLARAIAQDELAALLRSQLLAEILASMNDDYSFGLYDQALSTVLAILSLAELGYRGQGMRVAQLRLLEFIDRDGLLPKATPFYSSLRLNTQVDDLAMLGLLMTQAFSSSTKQKQICQVAGEYHSISLYEDTHSLITTALAALSLAEPYIADTQEYGDLLESEIHPRYLCRNHSEYIAKFALPPYLVNKVQLAV